MSLAANPTYRRAFLIILSVLLVIVILAACMIGPVKIGLERTLAILTDRIGLSLDLEAYDRVQESVLVNIRLPRVVLGVLVGAALGISGAAMQGLFRNPLADPGLIGVSSGGAIGAIFMIVAWEGLFGAMPDWFAPIALPVSAMVGGILVTFLIYHIAKVGGRTNVAMMLLTGIAINSLGGAFMGFMIFLSTEEELRSFTFWSLGSLGTASWNRLGAAVILILSPLFLIFFFARPLNAFLLGEAEAHHLGVNTQRVKRLIIVFAAGMVGASVALCGIIGFVGLVVPHIVRVVIGPDHRNLFPGAALMGALLLVAADLTARNVVAPAELPIGVITALVGAPFFLGLLLASKRRQFG